jgi:acyl transferase domain-containing protein/acyl carrier protein
VLGHSLGDFAAAYAAGVLGLEEGLRLVTRRGELMEQAAGEMVAVMASAQAVAPFVEPYPDAAIGVVNGPASVVVSGARASVAAITQALQGAGFKSRRLAIPVAAHSPMLDPVLDEFEEAVRATPLSAPKLPVVSSMTGSWVSEELTQPGYWRAHLRNTVRFADGLTTLSEAGVSLWVEIGPRPTLLGMVEQQTIDSGSRDVVLIPTLRPEQSDLRQLLVAVSTLYMCGVEIDWQRMNREGEHARVVLPTYPFQRQRCWVKPKAERRGNAALRPLVDKQLRLARQQLTVFEKRLSTAITPFVADHIVLGEPVVPGAAHLALALSCADLLFGGAPCLLEDIVFSQALVLSGETERNVQLLLESAEDLKRSGNLAPFQIVSVDGSSGEDEQVHVSGYLGCRLPAVPVVDLSALQARCTKGLSPQYFYDTLAAGPVSLGPTFRWFTSVGQGENGELLACCEWPESITETEGYLFFPTLLDACFQLAAAGPLYDEGNVTFRMPFILGALHLYRPAQGERWWCHTVQSAKDTWDITLLDAAGELVAWMQGFQTRTASAATVQAIQGGQSRADWFYTVDWQQRPFYGLLPDYLPALSEVTAALQKKAQQLLPAGAAAHFFAQQSGLEELSRAFVLACMNQAGFPWQIGSLWSSEQIARQLGVLPVYRRLLERLLTLLEAWMQREGAGWRVIGLPDPVDPARLAAAQRQTGGDRPELRLLTRCGAQLRAVLNGTQEALELLFPGGDTTELAELYAQSSATNALAQEVLGQILHRLPEGRGLQIVEVGAGTGSVTSGLLALLPAARTDYLFTDVGASFLSNARERFVEYPFVRYQLLDIEQPPSAQGFPLHKADLVIAANVLHATRDLGETLAHIRQLLQPGGELLLVEAVERSAWLDLTFGLTDGWWRFTDHRQEHPLLTAQQWTALLQAHGFAVTSIEQQGQGVILAQVEAALPAEEPAEAAWLIFADTQGVGDRLAAQYRNAGVSCRLVYPGEYSSLSLASSELADYRHLLRSCPALQGIVYLWSLDLPVLQLEDDPVVGFQQCTMPIHQLVQALAEEQRTLPAGLWLVTNNARSVTPADDPVDGLSQSVVWGLGAVVPTKNPGLKTVCIDLTLRAGAVQQAAALYAELTAETTLAAERQVAFRERGRYVARLRHWVAESPSPTVVCRPNATYLVVGSLQGVGQQVVQWLSAQGARQILWLDRDGQVDLAVQTQLAAWSAQGIAVTRHLLASEEPAAIQNLLSQIDPELPLEGIFYLVRTDSSTHASALQIEEAAGAEIRRAWQLHAATCDRPLARFVVISAATPLLEEQGLGVRHPADVFLVDAFVQSLIQHRAHQGLPAALIQWGLSSTEKDDPKLARQRESALAVLLAQPQAEVGVLDGALWSKESVSAFYHEVVQDSPRLVPLPAVAAVAPPNLLQQLAEALEDERKELLMTHIQEMLAKVLGLSALPATYLGFTDLGMDSLMGIELRRMLERSLQISLRSTLAFEYPTVEALADYLLTAGLTERLAAASSQSAGARSLAKPSPGLVESVKHEKSDLSVSGGAEEALPDEASVEAKLRRLEALLQGDDAGGTYHR